MLQEMTAESTKVQTPNLIPVVRELPADLETPISAYLKLAGTGPSFLLESVTGGEQVARYSFIGVDASEAYVIRGRSLERHTADGVVTSTFPDDADDLLDALRDELTQYRPLPVHGLPRFNGGLVGYVGYDAVRAFEPTLKLSPHPELPDAIFLLADTLVAFDHAFGKMTLIANAHVNGNTEAEARTDAERRLDALQERLSTPLPPLPTSDDSVMPTELSSNMTHQRFTDAVRTAKEHIAAGDIFQVVLSQRLSRETPAAPFSIYRALRRLNPSPYMFFFDFAGLADETPFYLIGASPEVHVRLEGRTAALRPIAGTRRRGGTPEEDAALELELLADPKERAEHVMLVDLARNDLGRVCEYGSVHVPEQMVIERYSHVMHIVSQTEGKLHANHDAFDLLRATFPAGTVSGAPKIRAMEIINGQEGEPRGPYAGVVGYFSYDGSMDTCIAIRTMMMRGQRVSVQAGAGIVADSDPDREYEETMNKAKALAVAVEMAEKETRFLGKKRVSPEEKDL
ncbi:MAG: anthranilate synthase component I [Anaerolineae bacterium]|nr:anthranilate synthase component I [Anaerolineae bacterium]